MISLFDIAIILRSSGLDVQRQEELLAVLGGATVEQLVIVADLLKAEPTLAEKLYENYAMKRQAYENMDPSAWDDILAREKEFFELTSKTE